MPLNSVVFHNTKHNSVFLSAPERCKTIVCDIASMTYAIEMWGVFQDQTFVPKHLPRLQDDLRW